MSTPDRLRKGTAVRIIKHRPGWIARVEDYSAPCRFYTVRLTHDAMGQRVPGKRFDGPYCRSELEPLTDPPPGSPSSPATGARDGALFSGGPQ